MSGIVLDLLAHASRLPVAVLPRTVVIHEAQVRWGVPDSIVEDAYCKLRLVPVLPTSMLVCRLMNRFLWHDRSMLYCASLAQCELTH